MMGLLMGMYKPFWQVLYSGEGLLFEMQEWTISIVHVLIKVFRFSRKTL